MNVEQDGRNRQGSQPLRILLVDSSPVVLERLSRALGEIDRTQVVGLSQESTHAIECVNKLSPDLVVVDSSLRVGNGWDVVQHITESAMQASIFVFSSDSSAAVKNRLVLAGASQVFDKSLEFSALLNAVRALAKKNEQSDSSQ